MLAINRPGDEGTCLCLIFMDDDGEEGLLPEGLEGKIEAEFNGTLTKRYICDFYLVFSKLNHQSCVQ